MNGYQATILALFKTYNDINKQITKAAINWRQEPWVYATLKKYKLVRHVEYLNEADNQALFKLILAYQLKGTYESLVLACEALLGSEINIIKVAPAVLQIKVGNATSKVSKALANYSYTKAIGTHDDKGIEVLSIKDTSRDLLLDNLIQEFVGAGIHFSIVLNAKSVYPTIDGVFPMINGVYPLV